ncbi:methyltransferase domain-containing protein [Streptomyces sp. NPDC005227]|uniref:methyltransferase domain-containing protein n=1 Tax=unclassified Streptomyces TaxID=2593676 RepID=UPI003684502E
MEPSRSRSSAGPGYDIGERLVDRHSAGQDRPLLFELLGLPWDLLPGVFAPVHTASTELFTQWVPYPMGGRFLEVGCGAGVTAVTAALRGCQRVTALDIAPAAVRNTVLNAARHGVGDRVHALQSDLFDVLDPRTRFDVVFWNSNVVLAPDDFRYSSDVQHAIFDRGYQTHHRYLSQGPARLTDGGRLLLGFNTLGDREQLENLAAKAGLQITELNHATRQAGDTPVTFQLLDLTSTV